MVPRPARVARPVVFGFHLVKAWLGFKGESMSRTKDRVLFQRIRVPLGFACAAAYFVFSRPEWASVCFGVPVVCCGAFFRAWGAGHLRKNMEVTVSGPYRFTRNPLYFGSWLLAMGFSLQSGFAWLAPLAGAAFLLVYIPVMRQEERDLLRGFGGSFQSYCRKVPMFFPKLSTAYPPTKAFSLQNVVKNREYNALFGALAVEALVVVKALTPQLNIWRT